MNITLRKRLCLTAMMLLGAVVYTATAQAETSRLVIESGDSALSRQQAAMQKNNGMTPVVCVRKLTNARKRVG